MTFLKYIFLCAAVATATATVAKQDIPEKKRTHPSRGVADYGLGPVCTRLYLYPIPRNKAASGPGGGCVDTLRFEGFSFFHFHFFFALSALRFFAFGRSPHFISFLQPTLRRCCWPFPKRRRRTGNSCTCTDRVGGSSELKDSAPGLSH